MNSHDVQHLKLLSVFNKILGGFSIVFSLLPLIHVAIGIGMLQSPASFAGKGTPPSPLFAWLFIILGTLFIVLGIAFSVCLLLSGKYIAQRKRYWFSFIVACIACILFPFGTVLGVFTIIVLSRQSVKEMYHIQ